MTTSEIIVATGSYTSEERGRGTGVDLLAVTEQGAVRRLTQVPLEDPSFVVWSADGTLLHVVHETDPTRVSTLRVSADGTEAEVVADLTLRGSGGCHIALGARGRTLVVANYGSGSVETIALSEEGLLAELIDLDDHGRADGRRRFRDPHPHQVTALPGTSLLAVTDLGLDAVFLYEQSPWGSLDLQGQVMFPRGSGPRHLATDHEAAELHLACELDGTVTTAVRRRNPETGEISWVSRGSVRSTRHDGDCAPSHIEITRHENNLLVANRGPDTLAALSLGQMRPTIIDEIEVGAHPRHFTRVGELTLVAAQEGDRIDVLAWNGDRLRVVADPFPSPSVTCIAPRP
ncbi:beta-propeller fold lactonase family protein [Brachybacterium sp. EF45031]|uniref:lactonase family protein n=1 Tax=Brachybacterium sillae TaxID=2810536 RepID=UPI00217D45BD|nr:lactonase family protein [Brachybacterium sillae]MCS6711266.1 beta-propeller fold lactonase family protein [Brachybacterium sillae]